MLSSWKKWEKKGDPHLINRIQWDQAERDAVNQVFDSDWFGYGPIQKDFEKKLEEFTGLGKVYLTNSGSTAIQTGIKTLIHQGRLSRGDRILHPVTTFPTSISSAIDYGLVPVFVETKPNTYVIDEDQVERAIKLHPEIKGMILPHLLGNVPNMERIRAVLGDRILLEDCCDTLGSRFDGGHVGTFGDCAAFSFYGSHHITAGGVGGAIGTNDERLADLAKSMIFWGHDYGVDQTFLNRYEEATLGNDFQMSAPQAAFGLAQMAKLPGFIAARKKQFAEMKNLFGQYPFFHLPESDPRSDPSWFCFPLVLRPDAPFTRENFVYALGKNNVEIRPIMCGNILNQKPFRHVERVTLDEDKFPIGDEISRNGLFIPCWGMPEDQKADYYKILRSFLDYHSPSSRSHQ